MKENLSRRPTNAGTVTSHRIVSRGSREPLAIQRRLGNRAFHELVETARSSRTPGIEAIPPLVARTLRQPGRPLDDPTRARLEQHFEHSLSDVRIHTDPLAARSARLLNALAYTWGSHIIFADKQYHLGHGDGQRLLAHETAHVIQQQSAAGLPTRIAPAGDHRESVAQAAAHAVGIGQTAQIPSPGPAMLSLTRDSRLERFIGGLPQLARDTASLNPSQRAERVVAYFSGVNLRDTDNYTPVTDAVSRFFPEQVLFAFLQLIETDVRVAQVATEEQRMQAQLRLMQVQPRGPYRTYTPFPVTEIVSGTAARALERAGGSLAAFIEGVIEGLGGPGSNELIARLNERLRAATILTAVAPVVFAAGAVVGILQDFWQAIRGIWELITNFSEMISKFRELFNLIMSPAGPALSRVMGRHTGQEWRTQLQQMAQYNVFHFTFELGRLIGPTIVYAVLAILGITAAATVSALVARFIRVLRQFPAALRIIERIGGFFRRRRRSPIAGATEAEIDAAIDAMFSERTTGGRSRPRIEDRPVPTTQRTRLDLEDLPTRPGETLRAALRRVRQIIGRKVSDIAEVRAAWDRARAHVLRDRTLTASNYEELYNLTRNRFWQEVRGDAVARRHFTDAGFEFPSGNTTAPVLSNVRAGIPVTETRVSLDHIAEKAVGENWRAALDADNLEMTFQMPNTYREIVQIRHGMRE